MNEGVLVDPKAREDAMIIVECIRVHAWPRSQAGTYAF